MCLENIDCVVLCGGLGERLSKLLAPNMPKVLAPINGRPILDYIIGMLQQHSATRVILAAGHLAHQLVEWSQDRPDDGLEVIISVQLTPDGTVDAVKTCRNLLKSEPVLFCNGDTVVNANLCEFVGRHNRGVSYLRASPSYVDGKHDGPAKPFDSGVRLFSKRHIDAMIRSGAYRIEDYVANYGTAIDVDGRFLDIGATAGHYRRASEFCRFLNA